MQPFVGQRLEPFATDSAGAYLRETIVICWVCYYDSKCQIWSLHLDRALDSVSCDQSLFLPKQQVTQSMKLVEPASLKSQIC